MLPKYFSKLEALLFDPLLYLFICKGIPCGSDKVQLQPLEECYDINTMAIIHINDKLKPTSPSHK